MTIRTDENFLTTMSKVVAGARGQIDAPVEASASDHLKLMKLLQNERKLRNELALHHAHLKNLLLRVLQHADIGHVWNFHEHCDAKYDRGPCTCGLAELEQAIEEATKQP